MKDYNLLNVRIQIDFKNKHINTQKKNLHTEKSQLINVEGTVELENNTSGINIIDSDKNHQC